MSLTISRFTEITVFLAAQWNGLANDLSEVTRVGFDLQAEEGQRTGQKPLVVHDPNYHGYNPQRIPIGSWAVKDVLRDELLIMTNEEMMEFIKKMNGPITISNDST